MNNVKHIYTYRLCRWINHLYAVSCTQQGRQRDPSVKTLHSPLFAEFWRHCVLRGRTQKNAGGNFVI